MQNTVRSFIILPGKMCSEPVEFILCLSSAVCLKNRLWIFLWRLQKSRQPYAKIRFLEVACGRMTLHGKSGIT